MTKPKAKKEVVVEKAEVVAEKAPIATERPAVSIPNRKLAVKRFVI